MKTDAQPPPERATETVPETALEASASAGKALDRQVHCEVMNVVWQDGEHAETVIPPYSTDIAAAWQVVERMQAEGWHRYQNYENRGLPTTESTLECYFERDRQEFGFEMQLERLPTAVDEAYVICRAALAAVEQSTP